MEPELPDRTEGAPFLSACLIVRDEERFLDRCLASLRGVVDEICVLDTGSRDRTLEIAEAHGARIGHLPWDDDFAQARNASLDLARGEWIFQIDADEELAVPPEGWKDVLRGGAPCHLVELELLSSKGPSERTWQPRLFRRDPRLRYTRALHETILDNLAEAGLPPPGRSPLLLIHHGYLEEVVSERGKLERNLRILRTCRDRGKADAYDSFKLAAALEASGEGIGEENARAWRDCLALGGKVDRKRRAEWPWWPRACRGAAQDLWCRGKLGDARETLERALDDFPGEPELLQTLADLELALGMPDAALSRLRGRQGVERLLGLCHLARRDWEGALAVVSGSESLAALAARALLATGRIDEAIGAISKAIPLVGDAASAALDLAGTLRSIGESGTAAPFLERPLRGSRIDLARCAVLAGATASSGAPGPDLDLAGATESVFEAVVAGSEPRAPDRGFPLRALLDGLADRLEAALAAGDEATVLSFARSALAWDPLIPGISRLVEGG